MKSRYCEQLQSKKILILTLVIELLGSHAEGSELYSGKGTILFTRLQRENDTGVQAIYTPDSFNYSNRLAQLTAKISFFGSVSENSSWNSYGERVLANRNISEPGMGWAVMSWNFEGGYFSYKHRSFKLNSGLWIGYGVDLYDWKGNHVYEDIHHYYLVPFTIVYCDLDMAGNSTIGLPCSKALQSMGNTSHTNNASEGSQTTGNDIGYLVYGGIGVAVILFSIGLCCCCCCCCRRRVSETQQNDSQGPVNEAANTSVTEVFPGEQNPVFTVPVGVRGPSTSRISLGSLEPQIPLSLLAAVPTKNERHVNQPSTLTSEPPPSYDELFFGS